ncbi:hypothetical protein HT031_005584 [Scenedesmus sp. PABB004]|nr:hypothetical protein HT031_005584 [Scenedesmus sp. PABB004]
MHAAGARSGLRGPAAAAAPPRAAAAAAAPRWAAASAPRPHWAAAAPRPLKLGLPPREQPSSGSPAPAPAPAPAPRRVACAAASGGAAVPTPAPERAAWRVPTYILLWYGFNIVFNLLNKSALNAFPCPWAIATWQLVASALFMAVLWASGLQPAPRVDRRFLAALLPVALFHTVGHVSACVSFSQVAVSFAHIVKSAEPVFSVLLSGPLLGTTYPWYVWASLLPIVGGCSLSALKEVSFSWAGFNNAMISNLGMVLRNILSKKSLNDYKHVDGINLFGLISIASLPFCVPAALLAERGAWAGAWEGAVAALGLPGLLQLLGASGLFYHLYNQASYMVLDAGVSPVTFSVGNTMKRVAVVVSAVLFFRNPVSPLNWLGSLCCRPPRAGAPDEVKTAEPAATPDPAATTEKYGLEAGLYQVLTSKQEEGAPPSRTAQAKALLAQYGSAYLLTSISFALVSFAACYAAVSAGVDVAALLSRFGLSVSDTSEKVGTFAIAYAAHKALSPVRFPPTVALTPVVAKWVGKKGSADAGGDAGGAGGDGAAQPHATPRLAAPWPRRGPQYASRAPRPWGPGSCWPAPSGRVQHTQLTATSGGSPAPAQAPQGLAKILATLGDSGDSPMGQLIPAFRAASTAASGDADSGAGSGSLETLDSMDSAASTAPGCTLQFSPSDPIRLNAHRMLAVSPALPGPMQRCKWSSFDYTIVEKLYTGYASKVYKAVCKASGEVVVLKSYQLSAICELYQHQIFREVGLHASLAHENVVALSAAFQEGDFVVLVQEYASGGNLFELLQKYGGRLSEHVAVQLVLEPFLRVLQYLHTRGIIHRDIKPENILFSGSMALKLADFGLAIDLRRERAVTRAGTLDYMAPEVLDCPYKNKPEENKDKAHLHYGGTVDSWAVGVLAYELLVGCPPFYDSSRDRVEARIRGGTPAFPRGMSDAARDFIASALTKDAGARPSVLSLLHHPWINTYRARRSLRALPATAAAGAPPAPPAPGYAAKAAKAGATSGSSAAPLAAAPAAAPAAAAPAAAPRGAAQDAAAPAPAAAGSRLAKDAPGARGYAASRTSPRLAAAAARTAAAAAALAAPAAPALKRGAALMAGKPPPGAGAGAASPRGWPATTNLVTPRDGGPPARAGSPTGLLRPTPDWRDAAAAATTSIDVNWATQHQAGGLAAWLGARGGQVARLEVARLDRMFLDALLASPSLALPCEALPGAARGVQAAAAVVESLGALTRLRRLELELDRDAANSEQTAALVVAIGGLTQLTCLNLDGFGLTGEVAATPVSALTALVELRLHPRVREVGRSLQSTQLPTGLTRLELNGLQLAPAALAACTGLRHLELGKCELSAQGGALLAAVGACTQLEHAAINPGNHDGPPAAAWAPLAALSGQLTSLSVGFGFGYAGGRVYLPCGTGAHPFPAGRVFSRLQRLQVAFGSRLFDDDELAAAQADVDCLAAACPALCELMLAYSSDWGKHEALRAIARR